VAPLGAPPAVAKVEVTIPAATTITAKDAAGKTVTLTAPTFTFQAPGDASSKTAGIAYVPAPPGPTGFILDETSVAIDVQITGATSSTFDKPITIVLPAPGKAAGSTIGTLYQVKSDGTTTVIPPGNFTVSANGTITVEVSNLCWFIGDPKYKKPSTGEITGATGGSGIGSF